jgi:hypothetical protein
VSLNEGMAYISFGIVLFVWEFLPTLAVVLFYRVKIPRRQQVCNICNHIFIFIINTLVTHAISRISITEGWVCRRDEGLWHV